MQKPMIHPSLAIFSQKVHKGTSKTSREEVWYKHFWPNRVLEADSRVAVRPYPGLRLFSRCFLTSPPQSFAQIWIKVFQNNCSSASLGLKAFRRIALHGYPRQSAFTLNILFGSGSVWCQFKLLHWWESCFPIAARSF